MMLPSHLLATVLLALLLARRRPFRAKDWLLALGFGVAIDLDHLLQIPAYVMAHGAAALTPGEMMRWGGAWQGFLHTPWALLPVLGAAAWFRSWWPPVFWGLHMVQDFVVARHYVHFGGPVEWLVVALLAGAVGLALHHGRAGAPFWAHAARTFCIPWGGAGPADEPAPAPA